MEGVSTRLYSGCKSYWKRRRGYERLNGPDRTTTKDRTESNRKRRFWKIKLTRKLKLRRFSFTFSPKKFLVMIRDAYVNMMLRIADTRVMNSGGLGGFGCVAGDRGFGMMRRPMKEYDDHRMLVEIYKSMAMAQAGL